MDQHERSLIDGLFTKLAQAERAGSPRDAAAEALLRQHVSAQPAAPYYMAQAIIVQEDALRAANQRLQQLETELAARPSGGGGGFLGSLFGGGAASSGPGRVPPMRPTAQQEQYQRYQQGGGGGFMSGALQTAAGVAGGMVLGNLLMDAFSGDALGGVENAAAEAAGGFMPTSDETTAAGEAFVDDPTADEGGDDFGGDDI